uniref:Uncharacterized protein n=1 Tax=Picea sitchensis TaxID=3332 RepID=A0A6B9XT61_PICSI|nr:hypothetical protein Q903MT_gene4236 [Picea sitchensis]
MDHEHLNKLLVLLALDQLLNQTNFVIECIISCLTWTWNWNCSCGII